MAVIDINEFSIALLETLGIENCRSITSATIHIKTNSPLIVNIERLPEIGVELDKNKVFKLLTEEFEISAKKK